MQAATQQLTHIRGHINRPLAYTNSFSLHLSFIQAFVFKNDYHNASGSILYSKVFVTLRLSSPFKRIFMSFLDSCCLIFSLL